MEYLTTQTSLDAITATVMSSKRKAGDLTSGLGIPDPKRRKVPPVSCLSSDKIALRETTWWLMSEAGALDLEVNDELRGGHDAPRSIILNIKFDGATRTNLFHTPHIVANSPNSAL